MERKKWKKKAPKPHRVICFSYCENGIDSQGGGRVREAPQRLQWSVNPSQASRRGSAATRRKRVSCVHIPAPDVIQDPAVDSPGLSRGNTEPIVRLPHHQAVENQLSSLDACCFRSFCGGVSQTSSKEKEALKLGDSPIAIVTLCNEPSIACLS